MAHHQNRELLKRVESFRTANLKFPTDRLTVADLRKISPEDFEWDHEKHPSFTEQLVFECVLDDALNYERRFALFSYCEQQRIPTKELTGYRIEDKAELIRMLHQSYEEAGLTDSREITASYLRDIEAQVHQQIESQRRSR